MEFEPMFLGGIVATFIVFGLGLAWVSTTGNLPRK